jgi:hypothetical protein
MLLTVWGWQTAWAVVALASIFLFLPPLLLGVVKPRMKAILRLAHASPAGPVPAPLYKLTHDPVLAAALQTLTAVVLGIVFLMTTKPALTGAIVAMLIAVGLGLGSSLPLARRSGSGRHTPGTPAE